MEYKLIKVLWTEQHLQVLGLSKHSHSVIQSVLDKIVIKNEKLMEWQGESLSGCSWEVLQGLLQQFGVVFALQKKNLKVKENGHIRSGWIVFPKEDFGIVHDRQ